MRRRSGRWNSPGAAVVYTSQSISLALLEILVNVSGSLLPHYSVIPVEFEDSAITTVDPARLPNGWRSFPGPYELKKIGDDWAAAMQSPVLRLPSAVVPEQWNYLLNPRHPGFDTIEIGASRAVEIDLRLL